MGNNIIELYLARHGETTGNLNNIIQGWHGGKLTLLGRGQALNLGFKTRNKGIEKIICGSLNRQKQTKNQINRIIQLPTQYIEITTNLRERGFGDDEGKYLSDLGLEDEKVRSIYNKDTIPELKNPETLNEINNRANKVIDHILLSRANKIMTIGSGWINSYIINNLLKEDFIEHRQENASAHYFILNQHGEVLEYQLEKIKVDKAKQN